MTQVWYPVLPSYFCPTRELLAVLRRLLDELGEQ